jgi:hypothetical protein
MRGLFLMIYTLSYQKEMIALPIRARNILEAAKTFFSSEPTAFVFIVQPRLAFVRQGSYEFRIEAFTLH